MSAIPEDRAHLVVLPGDGIGPEITQSAVEVLRTVDRLLGLNLSLEAHEIGLRTLATHGTAFPDHVWEAAKKADGVILGPGSRHAYPSFDEGGLTASGKLRVWLQLYANIRPARSRPGVPLPCGKPFDLVVCRENTEGFYSDRNMFKGHGEFMPTPDVVIAMRKITREGSMRIAEMAFALARRRRKKITAVTKFNVFQYSDGLFLECCREVQKKYPEVELDTKYIDAMTALLVRDPGSFDVVLTTNMYGDILSDLTSELSGSLGMGGSINASTEFALGQAQHGSAPDIEGMDLANPTSLITSAGMLLGWLGERRGDERFAKAAEVIDTALDATFAVPENRTRDLGGSLGTKEFTRRVIEQLALVHEKTAAAI